MSELLYASVYFRIEQDHQGTEFVRMGDEVVIVPLLDDGRVILVIEPSPAFGVPTILLPSGELRDGEGHRETANRELQEEIGMQAGRWDDLGELQANARYFAVRSFLYLARELGPSSLQGDEDYEIGQIWVDMKDIDRMIAAGELVDARTIAGLCLARDFLARDQNP